MTERSPNYDLGVKVGDMLNGSGSTVLEQLEALEIPNPEKMESDPDFCAGLDETVLLCAGCNWWVPSGEANTDSGDVMCEDCVMGECDEDAAQEDDLGDALDDMTPEQRKAFAVRGAH